MFWLQLDLTTVGQGANALVSANASNTGTSNVDSAGADTPSVDFSVSQDDLDTSRDRRQSLLQEIAQAHPDVVLISGGGMRHDEDCQQILSAGCQHVLVASAIYDGKLTPDDIAYLIPYRSDQRTRAAIEKTDHEKSDR